MKSRLAMMALPLALSVGLGLLHPFGNPRVEPSKGLDTLLVHARMPNEAKHILIAKCADCHSNETQWPVYARLAPGSWLIERDIVEARKKMNLSVWDEMSPEDKEQTIGKIIHEASGGKMPPAQYRLLHRNVSIGHMDLAALSSMQTGALPQAETLQTDGDPTRGKAVFEKRCTGCHALEGNREGPPLGGVFGRKAGSVARFDYSAGLKASGITWDKTSLERWLRDPDMVVSDNKMDFHLPKTQERSDIIAFFKHGRCETIRTPRSIPDLFSPAKQRREFPMEYLPSAACLNGVKERNGPRNPRRRVRCFGHSTRSWEIAYEASWLQ